MRYWADFITTTSESEFSARQEFAAQQRLPAMYETREFVNIGGLVSYGVDFHDLSRRAAGYVDRILRGAHPGRKRRSKKSA